MPATLNKAFGYQDDNMNLPVADVKAAIPFYVDVLGFTVVARGTAPHRSATLGRDSIQMRIAENGGDPTQDGCVFHCTGLDALLAEFQARGLAQRDDAIGEEKRDDGTWRVFYVVAPDGLCYWFGEKR